MATSQPTNQPSSLPASKAKIATPLPLITTSSNPAPAFTLFPLLPTELRLKIWEHHNAQTPPQILDLLICPVDVDHRTYRRKACFVHPHVLVLKQRCVPAILHTCVEAREVGSKYYTSNFEVQNPESGSPCSHQTSCSQSKAKTSAASIWWNPQKDIVHLDIGWAPKKSTAFIWGGAQISCFEQIRNLVVSQGTLVHVCIDTAGFETLERLFVLGEWEGEREKDRRDWGVYVERWELVQCLERRRGLKVELVGGLGEVLGFDS